MTPPGYEQQMVSLLSRILSALTVRRAPWQEVTLFQLPNPIITPSGLAISWIPIAPNNPNRVALFLNSTQAALVSPSNVIPISDGLNVGPSIPNLIITQKDHGIACTSEWYGVGGGGGSYTAIEIILREWPSNG